MKTTNFSTTFLVEQTPEEAFDAITNTSGWWTGNPGIEGSTDKLGDEFTYRYEPHHYSKQKITTLNPAKKVVWEVTESRLNFVDDKREWKKTAAWCPGIGQGELVQIETAQARAKEMRESYPEMYS